VASATLACVLLACTLLESCARYQPHPLNPVQSQAQFGARSIASPGALDLDALTDTALSFSSDLAVARAKAAASSAALITARQRINPSLSAEGGYNKTPESVATYSVSAAFTIETAGKRGYRILEAEKLAEASRIALYEAEWQVRSRIRTAAVTYYMAVNRLTLLQSESGVRDDVSSILTKRVSVGESAVPELNAARAEQAALSVALRNAEGEVAQGLAAMAAAAGLPVSALELRKIDLTAFDNPPASETLPLLKIERAGLLHRADIRRTLVEYEAADAKLRLEVANQYPNISLNPAYAFQEGFPAYTLGSVLESLPVFHRHEGPIAEAEAARHLVEMQFVLLQSQVISQTESSLRQYDAAVKEWSAARNTLETVQREREAAVMAAFRAGESDRMDVAQSHLLTSAAVRTRLEALSRAQSALGALEDAVQSRLIPETGK
jgi:outer membrane protein, heavy metal efflux system